MKFEVMSQVARNVRYNSLFIYCLIFLIDHVIWSQELSLRALFLIVSILDAMKSSTSKSMQTNIRR